MSQTTQSRTPDEPDDVPLLPRQQIPRIPDDDVPEMPDEQLPEMATHDVTEPPEPARPLVEPPSDEADHPRPTGLATADYVRKPNKDCN